MTSLRVAVALHAYGGVYPGTVKSIAAEMAEQVRRNDGVELYWAEPESDALLSRCRSKLVTQAVAQGVDVLVWLDRDIDWTPGDVSDLAKRCAEVKGTLGGAFPYRSESMRGKHFPVRSLPGQSLNVHPGHDEIHEVEFVSGGFVAFWVPALAEMVKRLEGHPNADLRVSKCAGGGVSWFWDVCRPVAIPYSPPREDGWLNYQSDDWCLMWRSFPPMPR